jgi:hypothetical protein
LRRFRPNRAAAIFLEADKPVHLQSPDLTGRIAEDAGPYLASGNWWNENKWSRQEWDAELETGALCRFHSNGEKWEVDGVYD